MSQLITLSKLATLISENTGIDLAVCEAFLRNMAQTVSNGLLEGEHIRIKDLGLFEVRRTPGAAPAVEFVPESLFAERVNAPFAHLQPTILSNPAYTATNGNPRQPSHTPHPDTAVSPATPQPEVPQQQVYPQQPGHAVYPSQQPTYQQPEPQAFPPQQPYQQPEPQAFPPQQTYQQPEPQAFPPQQPYQQPEHQAFPLQQPYQQPEPQAFPPQQPEFTQQQPYQPQEFAPQPEIFPGKQTPDNDMPSYLNLPKIDNIESQQDTPVAPASRPRRPAGYGRSLPQISDNKKYVLIGILGIIVGFALGYLTSKYLSGADQGNPETDYEMAEGIDIAAPKEVEPEYDYSSSLSVADTDSDMYDEVTDTVAAQPAPAPETIRVKLLKGQRLSDIALKYYGKKEYWVYIYIDNRESISNPFTVREGTMLKVPPKDKYAPTTDEAYNLQWAKTKGAEINNKYQHDK